MARALSSVLATKLDDLDATSIADDEAAMRLGLINGIVESIEREGRPSP